jgi:hypothetical protein
MDLRDRRYLGWVIILGVAVLAGVIAGLVVVKVGWLAGLDRGGIRPAGTPMTAARPSSLLSEPPTVAVPSTAQPPTAAVPSTPAATPSPTPQRSAHRPTHGATSPAKLVSVLRQREAPPRDVARYVSLFSGGAGGNPCGNFPIDAFTVPTVRVPGAAYRITPPNHGTAYMGARQEDICAFGFDRDTPIQVTLTFPTGDESQWTLCDPCGNSDYMRLPFTPLPDYPMGSYHVRASQASASAEGTFTLQPPTDPTFAVRENYVNYTDGVPRGAVVHIGVSGFPRSGQAQLLLYYSATPKDVGQFIASVPMAVDGAGNGLYTLLTRSDDPPGYYAIRTIPAIDTSRQETFLTFYLR